LSSNPTIGTFFDPLDQLLYQKASLLNRMNFVKLRGNCTAKIHISDEKFDELKSDFLNKIDKAVSEFDIPPELIYHWNHTGINYVPVSNWVLRWGPFCSSFLVFCVVFL
jgi:hypothetical protein